MEIKSELIECQDDDVVSFGDATFKVGKLRQALDNSIGYEVGNALNNQLRLQGILSSNSYLDDIFSSSNEILAWFNNGRNCEILNLGSKNWKNGKIRIKLSIEFYVEKQESLEVNFSNSLEISQDKSPLDDIRRMINQDS